MSGRGIPLRLASGPFLVWTGTRKLQHPERGEALLGSAAHSLPQLVDVFGNEPDRFARFLGGVELLLGAWVGSGVRPRASGLALAGFAAGTLSLLFTNPANRVAGSRWEPSAQGMPIAKDLWLLAAGLSLALDARRR